MPDDLKRFVSENQYVGVKNELLFGKTSAFCKNNLTKATLRGIDTLKEQNKEMKEPQIVTAKEVDNDVIYR